MSEIARWHFTLTIYCSTVKPVYKNHSWDLKVVAVVDRWSLFRGRLCNKTSKLDLKMAVIIDRWLLFEDGRKLRFDCILI